MLRSINPLKNYSLLSKEGDIGQCNDFLFDDQSWTIRYMVADTRKWLPGRKVLIYPSFFGEPQWKSGQFPVDMTKEQIKDSPPLDSDAPIGREFEKIILNHWNVPYWWENKSKALDTPLRSINETTGYSIRALDGKIGQAQDFIVDTKNWRILYMVIDTKKWFPGGRKVLIATSWIKKVDWFQRMVDIDLKVDTIKESPEYNPDEPVNREYETRLYDFYGREVYWE